MTKKITKILALTLVAVMLMAAFAGCSGRNTDPVVAQVGNVKLTLSEYQTIFSNMQSTYQQMGQYNVTNQDGTVNAEALAEFQSKVMDELINKGVILYAASQDDKFKLTDEEVAEVDKKVESELDSASNYYKTLVDSSITDEAEIKAKSLELFGDYLKKNTTYTLDSYKKMLKDEFTKDAIIEKVYNVVTEGIAANDEEIKEAYDKLLTADKTNYEATPANYATDMSAYLQDGGVRPLYAPKGYVYVKHIFINDEAEQTETGEDGEAAKTPEEKVQEVAAAIDALKEAGNLNEAEFDKLIEQYNEDPGMTRDPYKEKGYLLSEYNAADYYEQFSKAGLALRNIGDVSSAVKSDKGTHFIMLVSKVTEGEVALDEDVKKEIETQVTDDKKSTAYNNQVEEWKNSFKISRNDSLVRFVGR